LTKLIIAKYYNYEEIAYIKEQVWLEVWTL